VRDAGRMRGSAFCRRRVIRAASAATVMGVSAPLVWRALTDFGVWVLETLYHVSEGTMRNGPNGELDIPRRHIRTSHAGMLQLRRVSAC
jgi:hypothetical protein